MSGEPVLGWSLGKSDGKRRLEVKLSRPIEGSGRMVIEAQAALGGFPVKAEALRMCPGGRAAPQRLAAGGQRRCGADRGGRCQGPDPARARPISRRRGRKAAAGVCLSVSRRRTTATRSRRTRCCRKSALTEVTVYELAETDRRIIAGSGTGHPRGAVARVGDGDSGRSRGGLGHRRGSGGLRGGQRSEGRQTPAQDHFQTSGDEPPARQRAVGEKRSGQGRRVGTPAARVSRG